MERWAEGQSERFPELIGELLSLKVNMVLDMSVSAAFAAKRGTATGAQKLIASDPLGTGLVSQSGPARWEISRGSRSSSATSSAAIA